MKSIRLSLMVYFLALLAVALLAASLLVYRNAEQTLAAKPRAMGQLIHAQDRERCPEEERHVDNALREQAQSLARFVQLQFADEDKIEMRSKFLSLPVMGVCSSVLSPNGYLVAPLWVAEYAPGERPRPEERTGPGRTARFRW